MIHIMMTISIVLFMVVTIIEIREYNRLRQLSNTQAKYISLLEKRLRKVREDKNKEFNKKA